MRVAHALIHVELLIKQLRLRLLEDCPAMHSMHACIRLEVIRLDHINLLTSPLYLIATVKFKSLRMIAVPVHTYRLTEV